MGWNVKTRDHFVVKFVYFPIKLTGEPLSTWEIFGFSLKAKQNLITVGLQEQSDKFWAKSIPSPPSFTSQQVLGIMSSSRLATFEAHMYTDPTPKLKTHEKSSPWVFNVVDFSSADNAYFSWFFLTSLSAAELLSRCAATIRLVTMRLTRSD